MDRLVSIILWTSAAFLLTYVMPQVVRLVIDIQQCEDERHIYLQGVCLEVSTMNEEEDL